ncbi:MAG: FAD-dependent oxidoreductase, partial [Anaerolineae bacterium]
VYLAEGMKKAVGIPVIAVGVIREPQVAEEILEAGKADFVALGRALIADPEWPSKALAGEEKSIRKCIGCNECVLARHVEDAPLRCTLNPAVGKGGDFLQIGRADTSRKVIVVGGGPAGMEAARVAALRGHDVTLYEKEKRLGGALNIASLPPGKEKLNWVTEYYEHELSRLGVEVHLGAMADAQTVRALQPDVIVLATGSDPAIPDIPGVKGPNVLIAQELLAKRMHFVGQRIAVIGGGMLGLETAEYLATQGNAVTILKRYETIARSIEPLYAGYLLRQLGEAKVEIVTGGEVKEIASSGVIIQDRQGDTRLIAADWVVLAREPRPATGLARELEDLHPIVIGDAHQPGKIIDAIGEAFTVAKAF